MCQRYAGGRITGQTKITPVKVISAEADLPTVATRATQVSTIAMEKTLWMPDTNLRRQIATAEADLPTVATRATQVSTIAMEKSLWMPDTNPQKQIATAEVRQCTEKKSRRKKPARSGDLSLGPHNQKGL